LSANQLEGLDFGGSCGARIGDYDVDQAPLDRRLKLAPTRDRDERVLRAESDLQLGKQRAWKERSDVHEREAGSVS
jgi:hypothetical protein